MARYRPCGLCDRRVFHPASRRQVGPGQAAHRKTPPARGDTGDPDQPVRPLGPRRGVFHEGPERYGAVRRLRGAVPEPPGRLHRPGRAGSQGDFPALPDRHSDSERRLDLQFLRSPRRVPLRAVRWRQAPPVFPQQHPHHRGERRFRRPPQAYTPHGPGPIDRHPLPVEPALCRGPLRPPVLRGEYQRDGGGAPGDNQAVQRLSHDHGRPEHPRYRHPPLPGVHPVPKELPGPLRETGRDCRPVVFPARRAVFRLVPHGKRYAYGPLRNGYQGCAGAAPAVPVRWQ